MLQNDDFVTCKYAKFIFELIFVDFLFPECATGVIL